MKKRFQYWLLILQRYANRWWYAPAIAALAFADLFLIVIPIDGLLISYVMLSPRRWISTAVMVALGSSLGAITLAYTLNAHGLPFLLQISPGIEKGSVWLWTSHLMDQWGSWALFAVALGPIMQHPAIAVAAFAGFPVGKIFAVVLAGRLLKYLFLSWLATHAPGVINRLWGLKYELSEVGLLSDPAKKPD